jgi:hypothetical protein
MAQLNQKYVIALIQIRVKSQFFKVITFYLANLYDRVQFFLPRIIDITLTNNFSYSRFKKALKLVKIGFWLDNKNAVTYIPITENHNSRRLNY